MKPYRDLNENTSGRQKKTARLSHHADHHGGMGARGWWGSPHPTPIMPLAPCLAVSHHHPRTPHTPFRKNRTNPSSHAPPPTLLRPDTRWKAHIIAASPLARRQPCAEWKNTPHTARKKTRTALGRAKHAPPHLC